MGDAEVPTPSDCLDPNMTYCTFKNTSMKEVYSGIDGVCMPSPSPGSNPCQDGVNDTSDYTKPGGTDFISKWGDAFPDWLNVYTGNNTNTLRLMYCGEESAAPTSRSPSCNPNLATATGKYNELFSGPIGGPDFNDKCCDIPAASPGSDPSGSPGSDPSGSPVPGPSGPPAPPTPSGGDALRACTDLYTVDLDGDGSPSPVPPFPCSPYDTFQSTAFATNLNDNISTVCARWETTDDAGTSTLTPGDLVKWRALKARAMVNCRDPLRVQNIYDNIFTTVDAANAFNANQGDLINTINAGGDDAVAALADLTGIQDGEIPMSVYNNYIDANANMAAQIISSTPLNDGTNNYINYDKTYKNSSEDYVPTNILVATQFN